MTDLRECVAMLRSPDPSIRRRAVCILERMAWRSVRAARLLVYALGDTSSSVRARAVWSLASMQLETDRIDAKLLNLLDDPSPRVFAKAMQVIGLREQRTQAAVDAVASFLDHSAPMARRLALDTLADIAAPDDISAERVTQMFQDRNPVVRVSAIMALASIFGPHPEFAQPVRALLRDPDGLVRSEAISFLVESGPPTEDLIQDILDASRRSVFCLLTASFAPPRMGPLASRALHELQLSVPGSASGQGPEKLPSPRPGEVRIAVSADDQRQVISSWPDLRAWEQTDEGSWRPCKDPGLNLHKLAEAIDKTASHADDMAGMPNSSELTEYEVFLEAIPQRVRNWVMGFPVGHWRLLNAFSRWGSLADDLANSHSHALLFMLAHLDQFQHGCTAQDWFRAGELIRGRQREALTALGLEGRESVVRILRKIAPGTCSVPRLKPLRKLLRDPATYKTLAHLPRINAAVLECIELYDKKLFCTWPLLVEMGESRSDDTAGQAVVDLFVVQMFAESLGCVDRLKPVRSLSQLEALRDELAEAEYRLEHESVEFPPPPLPPLAGQIEPLRTPAELWLEGQEMKHCAANYVQAVAQGTAYLYRIVGCEEDDIDRATLMIVRDDTSKGWRISDLRRACNVVAVSPPTKYTVQQFMAGKEHRSETAPLLPGLWSDQPESDVGPRRRIVRLP